MSILLIIKIHVLRKAIALLTILFIILPGVLAQEAVFYKAYVSNQMDSWKAEMDKLDEEVQAESSMDVVFELTIAQYGYIAWCMAVDQKKQAREYVIKARDNAERMLAYDSKWGRAHATRGAIYGFEAGQAPYKAIVLGGRAIREVNMAMLLDPDNPYIWMEKGNIDLYKPSIFGGNKNDAVRYYLKAIELFEEDAENLKENWLYLNTLIGLAEAYRRTGRIKRADKTYRKILEIEPAFNWIRDEKYPAFRKKYFGD